MLSVQRVLLACVRGTQAHLPLPVSPSSSGKVPLPWRLAKSTGSGERLGVELLDQGRSAPWAVRSGAGIRSRLEAQSLFWSRGHTLGMEVTQSTLQVKILRGQHSHQLPSELLQMFYVAFLYQHHFNLLWRIINF